MGRRIMTDFWTDHLAQQAATEQYDYCRRCGCDIELDHNCEPIFRQRCGDTLAGAYIPNSEPTDDCNDRHDERLDRAIERTLGYRYFEMFDNGIPKDKETTPQDEAIERMGV